MYFEGTRAARLGFFLFVGVSFADSRFTREEGIRVETRSPAMRRVSTPPPKWRRPRLIPGGALRGWTPASDR